MRERLAAAFALLAVPVLAGCGNPTVEPCEVTITSPLADTVFVEGIDEDADPSTPGFQVRVDGTTDGDGCNEVAVFIDGAAPSFMPFTAPDFSGQVTLASVSEPQVIVAQVRNDADEDGDDRVSVRLRTQAPEAEIEEPATGSQFNAADDQTPGDAFCTVDVTVGCSEVGSPVELFLEASPPTLLGQATCEAAAGNPDFDGQASFAGVMLPSDAAFEAFNVFAVHTLGSLEGTSPFASYQADCEPPELTFARPDVCPFDLDGAADEDPDEDGIQFQTEIDRSEASDPVTLVIRTAGGGPVFGPVEDTAGGPTATFVGATYGVGGTLVAEATSTDLAGNMGEADCQVEVFEIPTLEVTLPQDRAHLPPDDDCDTGTPEFEIQVSATTDAPEGTPAVVTIDGVETDVTVDASGQIEACVPAMGGRDLTGSVRVGTAPAVASAMFTYSVFLGEPPTALELTLGAIVDRRDGIIAGSWTAVPDINGDPLESYELRCSASAPITDEMTWGDARALPLTTVPAASGADESEDIDGFRVGETTNCVLRGRDAADQLTPIPVANEPGTVDFEETVVTPQGGTTSFGRNITPIGDVNDDGVTDLAIAADDELHLFFGGATLDTTPDVVIGGPAGSGFAGTPGLIQLTGTYVAGIGDFNDDGIDDFAVGAPFEAVFAGRAYVFYGRTTWPTAITVGSAGCDADLCYDSDVTAFQGQLVASAGDFNDDGVPDLMVGAPGIGAAPPLLGRIYILLGGADPVDGSLPSAEPDGFRLEGLAATYVGLGASGDSAGGDVDGVPGEDIVFGAPGSTTGPVDGALLFVSGRSHTGPGLETVPTGDYLEIATGGAAETALVVHPLGDINADTYPDVGYFDAGRNSLIGVLGTATGFASPSMEIRYTTNAPPGMEGDSLGFSFGSGIIAASDALGRIGDIDVDGIVDVFVGARQITDGPGSSDLHYRSSRTARVFRENISVRRFDAGGASPAAFTGDLDADTWDDLAVGDPTGNRVIILR